MAKLEYLIIHCTATPEGRDVSEADIRHWHTSPISQGGRGWKQIGYTWLINLSGELIQMVPNNNDPFVDPWEITNGVAGINSISNHIVYAGGMDQFNKVAKDTRTCPQTLTLTKFVHNYLIIHPTVKIAGHNQFAAKACPSFDVPNWLREIGVPEHNIYKAL